MRIVVLGGYGMFGKRISARLAALQGIELIVAGRNAAAAQTLVSELRKTDSNRASVRAHALDLQSTNFAEQLALLHADLLIHSAGPFQAQDYTVARAAIACGTHYIDLADGRDFVAGFACALDASAKAARVFAICGASSVPALSAAVVDALGFGLHQLQQIDIAISLGNRTERGAATVGAILGYVGQPGICWIDGAWKPVRGWLQQRRILFPPPVGPRWVGHCEVPDLQLFPSRYPGVSTVRFGAGLELRSLHFGLWVGAWLTRLGMVRNWSRWLRPLFSLAQRLRNFGSDAGAMRVEVHGTDQQGQLQRRSWSLLALQGCGPEVPCTAAVLLVELLRSGGALPHGAMPCMGLLNLQQFESAFAQWPIRCLRH